MIHLVLLSGGSGTRLWPLSNSSRSKQFLKVLRNQGGNHVSMVQRVISQVRAVDADLDVTIATCADQEFSIRSQVGGDYELVLEPERRDTAPAIMLACASLSMEQGADASETVVVMPIDTYADQAYYDGITRLDEAVQSGFADLVLLGVRPTYPSEKYGYVVPSGPEGGLRRVERFTEKPDATTAEALITEGALWNCGVFAFRLGWLIAISDGYLRAGSFEEFRSRYAELPRNSFDYEVVERADSIGVVPYIGTWKDLGTWNTLSEEMEDAVSGRAVMDDSNCHNVNIINETSLPIVVSGLSDAVVVATPDGILACGKDTSAGIKPYVSQVAESRPMCARCSWGEYRITESGVHPDGIKSIIWDVVIYKGSQIPYQFHRHHSEVWTIVSGVGEVERDGEIIPVSRKSVVCIGTGIRYTVRSVDTELHIVVVQFDEQSIEEGSEDFGDMW